MGKAVVDRSPRLSIVEYDSNSMEDQTKTSFSFFCVNSSSFFALIIKWNWKVLWKQTLCLVKVVFPSDSIRRCWKRLVLGEQMTAFHSTRFSV